MQEILYYICNKAETSTDHKFGANFSALSTLQISVYCGHVVMVIEYLLYLWMNNIWINHMVFFFNEEHRISQHGYPISEKKTKSGIHGFKGTVYLTISVQ